MKGTLELTTPATPLELPAAVARSFVGEAEAYALLADAGLLPPRHGVVGGPLPFTPSERVVLKGLGDELWHKSELGAVRLMNFNAAAVARRAAAMRSRIEAAGHRWLGGLVCERVALARADGLPSEGFISLTHGEAGWIVLCGFGGLQAEALAALAPPRRWPLEFTRPAEALAELKTHLLGRIWLGLLRGTKPLTTAKQLENFLNSLWQLAWLADADGISLLEMNPVVLDESGQPRPLDAVGRRSPPVAKRVAPSPNFLSVLRAPRSVALAGVSEQEGGVGRTILENLLRCPALVGRITLIKPGYASLLGLSCVPDVGALLKTPVDLLLLALPAVIAAQTLAKLIEQGGGAEVVALVSGGISDGADTQGLGPTLTGQLHAARAAGRWTPTILGPNFLGHWVPAAGLDTSFIPLEKFAPANPAGSGLTLLSQSGAFLLSRRSRQPQLRFGLGVALGNQMDVALPDFLRALATDPACQAVAAYVEGFGPGHLLETARAAAQLSARGVRVVMHRAGRTEAGQAAAASHTGAMAGDLELERALLERAGVRFTPSIAAFDAALTWLGAYPQLRAGPVALVTNAGFESVNGSDLLAAPLVAATVGDPLKIFMEQWLQREGLAGLVAPRLPLDLTPMAGEAAFLGAAELLLAADCRTLVLGLVPFTRRLNNDPTGAQQFATTLATLARAHGKQLAIAVDAGPDYESYRTAFAEVGLPVFARVEDALLGLRVLA